MSSYTNSSMPSVTGFLEAVSACWSMTASYYLVGTVQVTVDPSNNATVTSTVYDLDTAANNISIYNPTGTIFQTNQIATTWGTVVTYPTAIVSLFDAATYNASLAVGNWSTLGIASSQLPTRIGESVLVLEDQYLGGYDPYGWGWTLTQCSTQSGIVNVGEFLIVPQDESAILATSTTTLSSLSPTAAVTSRTTTAAVPAASIPSAAPSPTSVPALPDVITSTSVTQSASSSAVEPLVPASSPIPQQSSVQPGPASKPSGADSGTNGAIQTPAQPSVVTGSLTESASFYTAFETTPTLLPITIGSSVATAISSAYVIGTATLNPGSTVIVQGTTYSLASDATALIVGTSTVFATTKGVGSYIWSGIGGSTTTQRSSSSTPAPYSNAAVKMPPAPYWRCMVWTLCLCVFGLGADIP